VLFRVDDHPFAIFLGHIPIADIALGKDQRVSLLKLELPAIAQG
jgi:hypothetical protein